MKIFRTAITFSLFYLCCSCSVDYLMPELTDSTQDWESTINQIIDENESTLLKNGVRLLSMKPLVVDSLEEHYFINESNSFFPIYNQDMSEFKIAPLEEVMRDTVGYHVKISIIQDKLSSLLNQGDKLIPVTLYWSNQEKEFTTVALFDAVSGELLYDNLLYNVVLVSTTTDDMLTPMMTSSEFENSFTNGSDNVTYSINNVPIVSASINWQEYGHWTYYDVLYPYNDNEFIRKYTYQHERTEFVFGHYINPNYSQTEYHYGYGVDNRVNNYSGHGYHFQYYLLAGNSAFPTFVYSGTDQNNENGVYKSRTVKVDPNRPDEHFLLDYL